MWEIRHKLKNVIEITHIVNASYYRFGKNYIFDGESHDFWEFIYVDKGEVRITAGDNAHILKAGEMAFHNPNEFHDVRAAGKEAPNAMVFSFVSKSRAMNYFKNKILFLSDEERLLLSRALHEAQLGFAARELAPPVYEIMRRSGAPFGSDQLLKGSLEALLISIYRREIVSHKDLRVQSKRTESIKQTVAGALDYIEKNYKSTPTTEEIARHIGVSRSYLKQVFSKQMGVGIRAYIINLKIAEAKRLISEGELNFTQIAERLGFDGIYYFSACFKKKTGMTPSEFALAILS